MTDAVLAKSDQQTIAEVMPTLKCFTKYPRLKPCSILADTGYFSEDNIKACESADITPYISFGKEQHN